MRTHQGQVALPGGKWDTSDRDLLQTALREAHEEIGLEPDRVEVLGSLDEHVTVTGFLITPFVGWVDEAFHPTPQTAEVARAFSAPLDVFEQPPASMARPGGAGGPLLPCSHYDGETIWGATYAILQELTARIRLAALLGRLERL